MEKLNSTLLIQKIFNVNFRIGCACGWTAGCSLTSLTCSMFPAAAFSFVVQKVWSCSIENAETALSVSEVTELSDSPDATSNALQRWNCFRADWKRMMTRLDNVHLVQDWNCGVGVGWGVELIWGIVGDGPRGGRWMWSVPINWHCPCEQKARALLLALPLMSICRSVSCLRMCLLTSSDRENRRPQPLQCKRTASPSVGANVSTEMLGTDKRFATPIDRAVMRNVHALGEVLRWLGEFAAPVYRCCQCSASCNFRCRSRQPGCFEEPTRREGWDLWIRSCELDFVVAVVVASNEKFVHCHCHWAQWQQQSQGLQCVLAALVGFCLWSCASM